MSKAFRLYASSWQSNFFGVLFLNFITGLIIGIPMLVGFLFLMPAFESMEATQYNNGSMADFGSSGVIGFSLIFLAMIIQIFLQPFKQSAIYLTLDKLNSGQYVGFKEFLYFGRAGYFRYFFTSLVMLIPTFIITLLFFIVCTIVFFSTDETGFILILLLFIPLAFVMLFVGVWFQGMYYLVAKGEKPLVSLFKMIRYTFTRNGIFYGLQIGLLTFIYLIISSFGLSFIIGIFEGLIGALIYGIIDDLEERNHTLI